MTNKIMDIRTDFPDYVGWDSLRVLYSKEKRTFLSMFEKNIFSALNLKTCFYYRRTSKVHTLFDISMTSVETPSLISTTSSTFPGITLGVAPP